MGTYTEFAFKAKLRKDTPTEVIKFLQQTVDGNIGVEKGLFHDCDGPKPEILHPFFQCSRWYMLFLSTNWGNISGSSFCLENGLYVLNIHSEFKNYDDEIDLFIDWIKPYIIGRKKREYVGYYLGEWMVQRSNIYIER